MSSLSSFKAVFQNNIFRIPDYQRGYAWGEEQLISFWDDLLNIGEERSHYMGVLSVEPVKKATWENWNDEEWILRDDVNPFYVVDGQQRLTTFSILIQSMYEYFKELPDSTGKEDSEIYIGNESLKDIRESYIYIAQKPLGILKAYKFGYEENNPSFDFLRVEIYGVEKNKSLEPNYYTLNLKEAKKFFVKNINKYAEEFGSKSIEHLYRKLTRKMLFNFYTLEDDFDVSVAFETMNNRGKRLSDLELLKNRLIYLTSLYSIKEIKENERKAVRKTINDSWAAVYHQLGRNELSPLSDNDFLRAHWIMYYAYSRKKGNDYIQYLLEEQFNPKKVLRQGFKSYQGLSDISEVREADYIEGDTIYEENDELVERKPDLLISEINDYVQSLRDTAEHWFNSWNPGLSKGLSGSEKLMLDRLNRVGIGYFRPLVVSSFVNQSITLEERLQLLERIERFIFVVFRVSRYMSNYRSSSYYGFARKLFFNDITVQEIIEELDSDMAWLHEDHDDNRTIRISGFQDHISRKFKSGGKGFYGWNGLKYLLYEYEHHLSGKRNNDKLPAWSKFKIKDGDQVSIEHVYPQTATDEYWVKRFNQFSDTEKNSLLGSLGNLLPLSQSINSSFQNYDFDIKKSPVTEKGQKIRNGYFDGSHSEIDVASNYPEWNAQAILARGLLILDFMEKRWDILLGDENTKKSLLHLSFLPEDKHQSKEQN